MERTTGLLAAQASPAPPASGPAADDRAVLQTAGVWELGSAGRPGQPARAGRILMVPLPDAPADELLAPFRAAAGGGWGERPPPANGP
jgi:hypothetical protein